MMNNEDIERKMNFIVEQQLSLFPIFNSCRNRSRELSKLWPGTSKP
jgi:hypothetical protein